jgi:nucleotide-binding universal stress UspA family protein
VLVPLDGSPFSEAALPHASALARAFGAQILLLRAFEPPFVSYEYAVTELLAASFETQRQEAESYLQGIAGRLRSDGLTVQTVAQQGWPADAIVRQALQSGGQLIIMATHGRSGVKRLLLGSVALEVVRRSLLPVFLVRPGESEASAGV